MQKAAAKKQPNSRSIAMALKKHWPKEAQEIVSVMGQAATTASMKRKLARVQRALAKLGDK